MHITPTKEIAMQMSTRIATLLPREDRKALEALRMTLKLKPRKKARKAYR